MKALITLLIIGTSSAAFARPISQADYEAQQTDPRYDVRDHRDDDRDDRYDDRYDGRYDQRDTRFDDHTGAWRRMWFRRPVLLASNVSMVRQWNRDQRPMLIDIDSRIGGIKRIRIDREEGRMFVDSVVINFADGHQQTVQLRRVLSAREPSISIELDHDAVTGMYLYGTTMRGRATFDVVGLRR